MGIIWRFPDPTDPLPHLLPCRLPQPQSGETDACLACARDERERTSRIERRVQAWEERREEISWGRRDWRSSRVVFPQVGEAREVGSCRSLRPAALLTGVHLAPCPWASVPWFGAEPLCLAGVRPPPLGLGGWRMQFHIRVLLAFPGDVDGGWETSVPLRGEFELPPPFSRLFRSCRLRVRGVLRVEGSRPSRKIRNERMWKAAAGDRTGLEVVDTLHPCPVVLPPWEWSVDTYATPHLSCCLWRVALSLLEWDAVEEVEREERRRRRRHSPEESEEGEQLGEDRPRRMLRRSPLAGEGTHLSTEDE